jgi:hypothetical protein
MRELRIDRLRKGVTELFDSLGNFAQSLHVRRWISAAVFIGDDRETFSQRLYQFRLTFRLHERENLKRRPLWRKRLRWEKARGFWWWMMTWRSAA